MHAPIKHLTGLTVCVDYADYLELSWQFNRTWLDRLVVVTTLREGASSWFSNDREIEVLCTDVFYENGAPFAKSRGLNFGWNYLQQTGAEWVVSLDADIVAGPGLQTALHDAKPDPTIIYGPAQKVHVQSDEVGSNFHDGARACAGFFQLFHLPSAPASFPEASRDCSYDDVMFSKQFKEVVYFDAPAYHLGPTMPDGVPNINWEGRKSEKCPLSRQQVIEAIRKNEGG